MVRLKVMNQPVTKIRAEVLVIGIFQDVRPLRGPAGEVDWIHHGILSRLILDGKISGKIGETILLATHRKLPTPKVFVLGLGEQERFSYPSLQKVCETTFNTLSQLQAKQCTMELFGLTECALDTTKSVATFMEVMEHTPVGKELDLSLLVCDENKAYQIQQQLLERSVLV